MVQSVPGDDALDTGPSKGEKELLGRPSISIRSRLALGFLSLFLFAVAVTAAAWVMLSRLEVRLRFLELADRYTMEIQQARRFEKNYFLYQTNLQDVQEHILNARRILLSAEAEAAYVLTSGEMGRVREHLDRYEALIRRLAEIESNRSTEVMGEKASIEAALRSHGSQMVAFALELAQHERDSVSHSFILFNQLPLFFLLVLLVLMVFIAHFMARQMLGPLTRLMATTQRIAKGDFTPIKPARKYRDEFSNLAVALNTMTKELAQRQEALVQSHKLRAVGTLTAGVAHELNNPINNITLTAAMLREDYRALTDEQRLEMVDDLVSQAERSQKIVRNLLDFAREGEIKTEKLDLGVLLHQTASLAANQIKLSGARIRLEFADNIPPIYGDRQSLVQVFLNLLLNALDAVGRGGQVTIGANGGREGDCLLVHVSDNGHGIPPHVLPRIFDPFFTTKLRGKGTGLGLSMSLGIVRQHGGDIRVESRPGGGTTFIVLLPASMVPGLGTAAPA